MTEPHAWPPGDSEMAGRIRTHHWAATPLGPIEGWPHSLRCAIDFILPAGFPMIVLWGDDLIQLYNDGYRALMGNKHPAGLGQPTRESWPEVWHINAPIYARVRQGETLTFEDSLYPITRSGRLEDAWFTLSYSPLRDDSGAIAGMLVTVTETTDQVRESRRRDAAEAALGKREERFRAFVNASSDVVYRMSADWSQMRELNGQGFLADTLEPSEDWRDRYILPEDREVVEAAINRAIHTKSMFELEHRVVRADGAIGWTRSRAAPILGADGGIEEWLGAAKDITAAKHAEAALRENDERLRGVLEGMGEGFGVIGPDFTILEHNREALRMDGRPKAEIVGRSHWDAFPGTEHSEVGRLLKRAMADRQPAFLEHRYAWEEGRALWLEMRVYPLADGALAVFWRDVTARRAAEEALRESEQLRSVALAAGRMGTWKWDLARREVQGDAQFLKLWGFPPSDKPLPLSAFTDRQSAEGHAQTEGVVTKAIEAGEEFDAPIQVASGPTAGKWLRWQGRAAADDSTIIYGVSFDITEQMDVEAALRASEERQAFLLRLTDALRTLTDAGEIERVATRLLGEHLAADRCFLSPVYEDGSGMCVREEYLRSGASSVLGDYTFAQFGDFVGPELHAGHILAVEDVGALTGLSATERESYATVGIGAYLLIPLIRNGRLAAFLTINHQTPRAWTEADKAVARQTADRLWIARERGRAEAALRESEARHRFRVELGDALHGLTSPPEIMATVAERLGPYLGVDQASYYEIEGERFVVTREWRTEATPGVVGSHRLADFGPSNEARLRSGEVIRLSDTHGVDGSDAFASLNIAALLSVPLHRDGRWAAGLHVLQARPRAWTEDEEALVREVAAHTWAAVDRARVETAMRESEERFREFGENSSDTLWIVDAETMRLEYLSPAFERVWGESREAMMANTARWAELVHPEDRERAAGAMPCSLAGEPNVIDYRIVRPDGEIRWIRDTGFPMREHGVVKRVGGIAQDVTDLKRAEQHQSVLLAELQHRVRNTLGVIRSIARRTAVNSGSVEEMSAHFDGRLDAFARVQAMVTRKPDAGVDLALLIEDELIVHAAREGGQVSLSGEPVSLPAKQAETLSLAVHELTTNAVKYGALATARGRVGVTWAVADGTLDLTWVESCVAGPIAEPNYEGFGMELLRRVLPYELRAEVKLDFRPDGLSFALKMPLQRGETA